MEITLCRHGRPNICPSQRWITSAEMQTWIAKYNEAEISDEPYSATVAECESSKFILTSSLPRARASLKAIGVVPNLITDGLREAALPGINIPLIRLAPPVWLILLRLSWCVGLSAGIESRESAVKRAKLVAGELADKSKKYGHVFSMGHGFMNRLISRELERLGWEKVDCSGKGFWGMTTYRHSGKSVSH